MVGRSRKESVFQLPGTIRVDRRHEISDRSFVEHSVAPQAVVVQLQPFVVPPIEEDLRVGDSVPAALPVVELVCVALAAPLLHLHEIRFGNAHSFAHPFVARGQVGLVLTAEFLIAIQEFLQVAIVAGRVGMWITGAGGQRPGETAGESQQAPTGVPPERSAAV